MKYMLDTNMCIYAIKNKPERVLRRIKEHLSEGLCISAITLAELEYGIEKSSHVEKNTVALLRVLSILEVLPFEGGAAMEHGKICAYLKTRGTPIGAMDMLIAAHARSEDLIVATNNAGEFEKVPGLRVENWADVIE